MQQHLNVHDGAHVCDVPGACLPRHRGLDRLLLLATALVRDVALAHCLYVLRLAALPCLPQFGFHLGELQHLLANKLVALRQPLVLPFVQGVMKVRRNLGAAQRVRPIGANPFRNLPLRVALNVQIDDRSAVDLDLARRALMPPYDVPSWP